MSDLSDEEITELHKLAVAAEPEQFAWLPVPLAEIDAARQRKREAQAAALAALTRLLDEVERYRKVRARSPSSAR